jgi:hypothetical protein
VSDKGEYRSIYVSFVDSWEFQQLSTAARMCLFLMKMKLGKTGIDVFYPECLPRLSGLPADACDAALAELQAGAEPWLIVERNVFWLRNGLKYDPSKPLSNPNGRKGTADHLRSLPNLRIVKDFAAYYALPEAGSPALSGSPFEAPSKPLRSTEEVEVNGNGLTTTTTTQVCVGDDEVHEVALRAVRAANVGMGANPLINGAFNPIPEAHGDSYQAVADLLRSGVPAETILDVVDARARAYRPKQRNRQIATLTYLRDAIVEEHERRTAVAAGLAAPPLQPNGTGRGASGRRVVDQFQYTPDTQAPEFTE